MLHSNEVIHPNLPRLQGLSTARLIDIAKKSPVVMKYLPDQEDLNPKNTNRAYLAAIINTLDPTFFAKAITKADNFKSRGANNSEGELVELDVAML